MYRLAYLNDTFKNADKKPAIQLDLFDPSNQKKQRGPKGGRFIKTDQGFIYRKDTQEWKDQTDYVVIRMINMLTLPTDLMYFIQKSGPLINTKTKKDALIERIKYLIDCAKETFIINMLEYRLELVEEINYDQTA